MVLKLRLTHYVSFLSRVKPRIPVSHPLKSVLIAGTFIFAFCTSAFAYQLTLEWDSNVEQDLAGYIVYYGTASRDYDYDVDVGEETSCTISNLYSGVTYYFAVTAYDIDGNESDYSPEITYPNFASGSGGGGCFISIASNGHSPAYGLMAILGLVLTIFSGFCWFITNAAKRQPKAYRKFTFPNLNPF
jgi:hypothetical protein